MSEGNLLVDLQGAGKDMKLYILHHANDMPIRHTPTESGDNHFLPTAAAQCLSPLHSRSECFRVLFRCCLQFYKTDEISLPFAASTHLHDLHIFQSWNHRLTPHTHCQHRTIVRLIRPPARGRLPLLALRWDSTEVSPRSATSLAIA